MSILYIICSRIYSYGYNSGNGGQLARASSDFESNPYLVNVSSDAVSEFVAELVGLAEQNNPTDPTESTDQTDHIDETDAYSYEYDYVYTTERPSSISGFGTEPDYIESTSDVEMSTASTTTTEILSRFETVSYTEDYITQEMGYSKWDTVESNKTEQDYFYYNESPIKYSETDSDLGRLVDDGFDDYSTKSGSVTNYMGCKSAEEAYAMDQTIKRIDCAEGLCNIVCKRKGEVANIDKIRCRNPRKNRWSPSPKKFGGPVACAPIIEQTTCGPVRKNYQVDPEVKLICKNDKCTVGCPEGKMSTLPTKNKQLICRNARKNVWNLRKTDKIQCLRPRSIENSKTNFCGHVEDHFAWYKVSD